MFHDRNDFRSLQLRRLTLGRSLLEVSGPSRPWTHGWLGGLLITRQITGPGERTRRFGRCPRVSALPARAGIKTLAALPIRGDRTT